MQSLNTRQFVFMLTPNCVMTMTNLTLTYLFICAEGNKA
jgi:hypothetical protein